MTRHGFYPGVKNKDGAGVGAWDGSNGVGSVEQPYPGSLAGPLAFLKTKKKKKKKKKGERIRPIFPLLMFMHNLPKEEIENALGSSVGECLPLQRSAEQW